MCADSGRLKLAKDAPHLAFGEVVGEDARAPPKCPGLHFLAQARPHVIRPELPEKEPSSAHEHARRLTGQGSAALCKQVPGHMESEDCIEAGTLQGQAAGVGQDKFDIRKKPATKLKGLAGDVQGDNFPVAGQRRQSFAVAAAQLQDSRACRQVGQIHNGAPPEAAAASVVFVPGLKVRIEVSVH